VLTDHPNDDHSPDPRDAAFYVRYVEICRRAGVDPSSPHRVRELVSKWNAMIRGDSASEGD